MAFATLIGVTFKCTTEHDQLPKLAEETATELLAKEREALALDQDGPSQLQPALAFLEDVVSKKAIFDGHKGSTCSWSTICNYGSLEDFVTTLAPFFARVFLAPRGTVKEIFVYSAHEGEPATKMTTVTQRSLSFEEQTIFFGGVGLMSEEDLR